MAESKRTFQAAKIERDLDDRLIQPGSYKDALNIAVAYSEDSNVGAAENIKGNILLDGQSILGLSSSSNPNAEVVGSYADPENRKIYYFVSGDKIDGIFEYDTFAKEIKTIILDGVGAGEEVAEVEIEEIIFTFDDAQVTATVSVDGKITATAQYGEIVDVETPNFNESVSADTVRNISLAVLVPEGYSNYNEVVFGTVQATQPEVTDPEVFITDVTNLEDTSVTLNAYFDADVDITAIGFKYAENTGGSSSYSDFTNKFLVLKKDVVNDIALLYERNKSNTFTGVPKSDITVIDGEGNTIVESSNWEYTKGINNQPSQIKFLDNDIDFPVTIGQTSTLTSITDGLSLSSLQSSGTDASVSTVQSPFFKDITGLTAETEYICQAYATTANGTFYSKALVFATNEASISLATFSSPSATASTEAVVFKATPSATGGDANSLLYVVSKEESSAPSFPGDYKTSAVTILGGGTVSGYRVDTIGSFTTGVEQSVTIPTTGGDTRYGLVFTKNSSTTNNGDGAGYNFHTAFVNATASTAVTVTTHLLARPGDFTNYQNFRHQEDSLSNQNYLQWQEQDGEVVSGTGLLRFDSTYFSNAQGVGRFIVYNPAALTFSMTGGSSYTLPSGAYFNDHRVRFTMSINDADATTSHSNVTMSPAAWYNTNTKITPYPTITMPSTGATASSSGGSQMNAYERNMSITVSSGGSVTWNVGWGDPDSAITSYQSASAASTNLGSYGSVSGTWSSSFNTSTGTGTITWTDNGSSTGTYSIFNEGIKYIQRWGVRADTVKGQNQVNPGVGSSNKPYYTLSFSQVTIT